MVDLPLILDTDDKTCPLKNCIRNNFRHVKKWAKRTETNCFRIYDRDIKEYPLAIDFYDGRFCVHCFVFAEDGGEPRDDLKIKAEEVLFSLFGATSEKIFWRARIKREKIEQYEKVGHTKEFFQVLEYGTKFWINLTDYLDTGLFLDHRETRQYVASCAKNKRLLNLFCYTASFSVQAAKQGALFTKSVDLSNTYTQWGQENFLLNGISLKNNPIIRADCMQFLEEEKDLYDVIVIDPPTISRSKKMEKMFDVQLDYIFLITKALQRLSPDGILIFSTNSRKFVLDPSKLPPCEIIDISKKTFPIDFRDPKIRVCWKISKKTS